MNDRELLEYIAAQVGGLTLKVDNIDKKVDNIDKKVDNIDKRLTKVEKQVTIIEIEHGKKLDALFDGQKQTNEILDRVEQQVERLTEKVELHDIEIKALKRAK